MNGGDQALNFLYLLGCIILVGSSLMVRRLPLGQSLKMVLAWLLIFGAVFIAFTLKDDFLALGRRAYAEVTGDNVVSVVSSGHREIRIRMADDGQFYINGEVNGHAVRFMVDSGASVTTLSRITARAAGVESDGGFGQLMQTGNGPVIDDRATADRLTVGPITRSSFAVNVSRRDDDLDVLGMNFLSTLSAWGVEGRTLVLKS